MAGTVIHTALLSALLAFTTYLPNLHTPLVFMVVVCRLGAHSLIPLVKEASSGKLVIHLDTPASESAAQGQFGLSR